MFIFMAYLLFTCLFIFWHVYCLRYSMFMFNTVGMFTFCLYNIYYLWHVNYFYLFLLFIWYLWFEMFIVYILACCLYVTYDLRHSVVICVKGMLLVYILACSYGVYDLWPFLFLFWGIYCLYGICNLWHVYC